METDIFRKRICNVCGKIEYKPYLGAEKDEHGFILEHKFEPSKYGNVVMSIDGNTGMLMTVCPECYRYIHRYLSDLPRCMMTKGV